MLTIFRTLGGSLDNEQQQLIQVGQSDLEVSHTTSCPILILNKD